MIDLTTTIINAQVAFALVIIAVALAYIAFGKKTPRSKK